ncbi:MAG: sodium:proton antiporter NhaD [Kofleriaceae bacterium]
MTDATPVILVALFVVGYAAIILERPLKLDKSASALLIGVLCWSVYALGGDPRAASRELVGHLGELSGILFFLLGAMTIVELIDAHGGFLVITSRITSRSRRKLLVIIAIFTFFLSAIIDNLTTSIFMMSVVRKLVRDDEDRMYYGGIVIIAANSGGGWSPIGDVTTTMLWIGGQITTARLITQLLIPSLVSILVPVAWGLHRLRGSVRGPDARETEGAIDTCTTPRVQKIVLFTGVGALAFVPVFKTVTQLPPFMGVLLGLGCLWLVTELLHRGKPHTERDPLTVAGALQRIDAPTILFFLGILLAISALQSVGILHGLAERMDRSLPNIDVITVSVGLSSAVIDNVPLVGAMQGMYPLTMFPTDHHFWIFLAYCAGTGGSILIIGSAAGVAVMGLQRISFGWYLRRFSVLALCGYLAGALCYLGMRWAGL